MLRGKPPTRPPKPCSLMIMSSRAASAANLPLFRVSIGVATVRSRSDRASPMVFSPRSRPSSRAPGGSSRRSNSVTAIKLRSFCRSGLRRRALPVLSVIASKFGAFLTDRDAQMSVDKDTVRRIAKLARLAVPEAGLGTMPRELNGIFRWVEILNEVDVEGVPAMTSVVAQKLKWRKDEVTDGNQADALMINAPGAEDHFFVVPKVHE